MRTLKLLVVLILLFTTTTTLFAQEFIWDIKFASQFDNREYNTTLTKSQTLFGARITPQIGIGWQQHSLNVGSDIMADFGAKTLFTDPTLLLYYAYNSKKFDAYMGVFPRSKMIGKYSSVFFSDSVRFYDQNLEGFMLQHIGEKGYVEIGLDWCGFGYQDQRERFMIFSSGEYHWRSLDIGYNATIFHFAASDEVKGVVDNILFNPYIGLDLTKNTRLDTLAIQVGWIQGLHKDRKIAEDYNMPGGVQVEVRVEKWNIGLYNTIYIGNNQMPYYSDYGSYLYLGNPYYRTNAKSPTINSVSSKLDGCYNRLEAYWHPYKGETFDLKVSSVHHYDGNVWGMQQLLTLNININKKTFKNRVKYSPE